MKKTIFTFLSFIISLSIVSAQKGIDFNKKYAAGGKLLMSVDSGAKNVYYSSIPPNQPNTYFNYLPEVSNLSIQIYFRKNINTQNYRYTILVDDKPLVVNKSIDKTQLKDVDMPDEVFSSTSLGTFAIKGKIITVLAYSIEKPQDIEKSVFYGKIIPKAKITRIAKLAVTNEGAKYSHLFISKSKTDIKFSEEDLQITVIKNKSDIDYLYYISIKDKKTDETILEPTPWQYGGYVEKHEHIPYLNIPKRVFKKSGEYEVIIRPFIKDHEPPKDIERYVTRHTLSITLEEESYSKKDLLVYGLIICAVFGAIAGALLTYVKKKEVKKLVQQYKEKEIVELQLSSVRSQLNPHFLFNALAGIQNLMNKNEIDNANKYLSKFARLTRNVLNNKELVSLAQEKTLLDDYLQMEQLRFGFSYEIKTNDNLDLENIEIPSMLLQPFVENAVKHGIASKNTEGKIEIAFSKNDNNLVLTVADNGKGFSADKKHEGLGLSLSKNRISLLNSIYKETPFVLAINSSDAGTKIDLTLTDWL
ncbi:MAG: histidine kinase [Pedobacter sp.]|uniref:sensor histidine kinase n=1 Tax=Pedobacter sp. TaxID=1411316 RepID=UPI002808F91D|nr:histidine kinase [Pedobacter sp.]MDQ8006524.1 histidine kinase [Pedobacter sp.]